MKFVALITVEHYLRIILTGISLDKTDTLEYTRKTGWRNVIKKSIFDIDEHKHRRKNNANRQ